MKQAAFLLALLLFVCTAYAGDGERPSGKAAPRTALTLDTATPLTCAKPSGGPLAQFDPSAQQGCVWIHANRDRKARIFTDPATFANVCPIVMEKWDINAACLNNGTTMPDIKRGNQVHLDYFNGSYELSIIGPSGAVVSAVPLAPVHVQLGAVSGYAWLKGTEGSRVYFIYMNDPRQTASEVETSRHYHLEIYDANNQVCSGDAPDVSAVENKDCVPVPVVGPASLGQGGTGPGGEPPPSKPN